MLSPVPSQQLLLSKSASNEIPVHEETPVHVHCPPYDLTQQDLGESNLNFAITAKKCDSPPAKKKKSENTLNAAVHAENGTNAINANVTAKTHALSVDIAADAVIVFMTASPALNLTPLRTKAMTEYVTLQECWRLQGGRLGLRKQL
ncbi:hypothetical protein DL98DRAFT_597614 [Cadophora sp. DSE1049]|nr:hypothetical protein DL98DRAFT_597614 [Cadophora sp. DSE1049]